MQFTIKLDSIAIKLDFRANNFRHIEFVSIKIYGKFMLNKQNKTA